MNKDIKEILNTLTNKGYEAYVIGGYVRDYLLGKTTKDIDICTNALPQVVANLFETNYNQYGGVKFNKNDLNIEITTFRKELIYHNRFPEVEFVNTLAEDIKRRDFTINAIAMDKEENIIDLLGGIADLNNQQIVLIGDAKKLKEDPLRILRAIRFATVLNFNLEDKLKEYIKENVNSLKTLSHNQINNELEKILSSNNKKKGIDLMEELNISKVINVKYVK